jgi:hypothetical protein
LVVTALYLFSTLHNISPTKTNEPDRKHEKPNRPEMNRAIKTKTSVTRITRIKVIPGEFVYCLFILDKIVHLLFGHKLSIHCPDKIVHSLSGQNCPFTVRTKLSIYCFVHLHQSNFLRVYGQNYSFSYQPIQWQI